MPSQGQKIRFDGSSTADQVLEGVDLQGKIAVFTGGNCGIGYETCRSLASKGCEVIIACRNTKTGEAASRTISEKFGHGKCSVMKLDLKSLKSVRTFSDNLLSKIDHLDALILNAGVYSPPFNLTEDGFEETFQVNHLSQVYLVLMLRRLFSSSDEKRIPRIIVLSSESHRWTPLTSSNISIDQLSPATSSQYWGIRAYGTTKLCNVLLAMELAKRWPFVKAYSCHPGNLVMTNLFRSHWLSRIICLFVKPFTKTIQLWTTSVELLHGKLPQEDFALLNPEDVNV